MSVPDPVEPKALPYDTAAVEALRPRAKQALRGRYRALRDALPAEAIATRSAAITAAVTAMEAWRSARTVALFSSLSDEVDTRGLVADARARGMTVVLPVVLDGIVHLVFRTAYSPLGEHRLVRGTWGIQEPEESAPEVAPEGIDLVVVPALAVDPRGHRLGYGRGYYDQTLPRAGRAVRVAVVFDFQLIAEVPEQGHDVPVDWIVTDRRVVCATVGRAGEPTPRGPGEIP